MIEGVHTANILDHMLGNLRRWRNDADVLHLTVEHSDMDFNATMQCMLRFLGMETDGHVFEELQAQSPRQVDPSHDTGSYDGDALRAFLATTPSLGERLTAWRKVFSAIFERQSILYGCPNPMARAALRYDTASSS